MRKWAYGVTTVPQRLGDLLPRTLGSLLRGGFPQPRLFVDGCEDDSQYKSFGLPITTRFPTIRTYGNWALGMHELFYRDAESDFYAIFQDDIIVCKNLREYLDRVVIPEDGYLNLYTTPENQAIAVGQKAQRGWFPSNQQGRGALALVFSRKLLLALLSDRLWLERPLNKERGFRSIDGGIVHSLSTRYYGKFTEYCHNPSLVQHIGEKSSMGNTLKAISPSFPGEDFDALSLLSTPVEQETPATIDDTDLSSSWALGSDVSQALTLLGIDHKRVSKWLLGACRGCPEGQRRRNQLGWLCKKALTGSTEEVKARFEEILEAQ